MTPASSSPPRGAAVGTVTSRQFLPFARVLIDSLRRYHPDLPVVVALVDATPADAAGVLPDADLVALDDLGFEDLAALRTSYSPSQLAIAGKAFLLGAMLDRGFDHAIFLDSDILVLGDLSPVLAPVRPQAIALTPHLLTPIGGATRVARELNVLQAGVYNGGFVGVRESPAARRFLAWWQDRLATHCVHDLANGIHNDQRWLEMVPAWFGPVEIVRDPGCNVAYWNLPERRVDVDGDLVRVEGRPAHFFHFSGFDPAAPDVVTRYSTRLTMSSIGAAAALFSRYTALLESASLTHLGRT